MSSATQGRPASMPGTRWSICSSVSTRSKRLLKPPKVTNLDGYISDPAFRELVPEVVWQKAEYIRQAGNVAVHGNKSPTPETALDVVTGALARALLDGSHLPAQGRGEPTGQDLRRIAHPESGTGNHPSQRPGAGCPEGPAGCGGGGPQGDRERTGSVA